MTTSFAELKRSSSTSFAKLTEELSKLNSPQDKSDDDRYWKPTLDKAGNGFAIIRFLPPSAGEDLPFIRIWNHGFKGPSGKWYIENSLTTLGKQDPLSEANQVLWNTGLESDKDIARDRKRKLSYYSNIYVVKDSGNPENEGKVFLYRYGKKIYDKINEKMNPSFEFEDSINPFDFWKGVNFKLKIKTITEQTGKKYPNYDESAFVETPSPLADDDKLEEIWKAQYSLQELLDPKHFKTYDELKAQLAKVLDSAPTTAEKAKEMEEIFDDGAKAPWEDEPVQKTKAAPKPAAKAAAEEDEDEDLDFFKSLLDTDE